MPLLPMLKFGKSKVPSPFLAVDINALDVKCLVFEVDGGQAAKIIGVGRQPLAKDAVRNGAILDTVAVSEALDLAIKKSIYELDTPVNKVIFGVGGDMNLGITTIARAERPMEAAITKKELDDIHKKVLDASFARAHMEFLQIMGESDFSLETLTKAVLYTRLDGRDVALIQGGLMGREVETAMFTAFVPSYHVAALVDLAKKSRRKLSAIGSEMYTLICCLTGSARESKNYVLVNANGDSTDVAVVFGGSIVLTKSLGLGRKHFVDALAQELKLEFLEAEALLRRYAKNETSEEESSSIEGALTEVLDIWLSGVELLFSDFSGVKTFAPTLYMTGGGFDIPDVSAAFVTEPWTKSIPFRAPPEFVKLDPCDFLEISDSTGKINTLEWTFPVSLAKICLEMQHDKT